ncbi:MAG: hypothetical protein HKN85_01385 [Gammaproteobacteria bacterium]|nr:hypothetical protein [Gammaproteobacteria bacterium]
MKKIAILLVGLVVAVASASIAYRIPSVRDSVAAVLPLELKIKIKQTLFAASALREELTLKEQELARLNEAIQAEKAAAKNQLRQKLFADVSSSPALAWTELAHVYSQSINSLSIDRSPRQNLAASDGRQYSLWQFPLSFLPTYFEFGFKPLLFLDSTEKEIYFITGDGVIFKTETGELDKNRMQLQTVPSNIRSVITDEAIYQSGWFSIKDLKILRNRAYISYNKKVGEQYTLAILSANLDSSPLIFEEFFSLPDPVSTSEPFNAHQVGGRIVEFSNNQLLISTGEYRKYEKPQDDNSLFGKIFAIDIDSKQTQIISKGHRNAQGLDYDPISGFVVSTEHGPLGGDEINLNATFNNNEGGNISNFGWPISSYGKHYDSRFHEDAPLHKSHKDHGFIEPIKQFTPSVGISEVIKVPDSFAQGYENDYFTATMGLNTRVAIHSLLHFRLDKNTGEITHQATLKIGERIRDIVVLNDTQLLIAMEGNSTPSIGLIEAKRR